MQFVAYGVSENRYICAPISNRLEMNTFELSGVVRTDTGKKATKADRVNGRIPCVIYGRNGAEHFTVAPSNVRRLIFTPSFNVVKLDINGKKSEAILKEVQYHPTTEEILHIDFIKLEDGYQVKADIPLRTKGVSPGVKAGGRLVQSVRTIKVKATPEKLVPELYVDISGLELGASIRVRDIQVPEGINIMTTAAVPVAIVEIPRALRSAATAAAKAAGK